MSVCHRLETGPGQSDAWGDDDDETNDRDYYNDRPGAVPPDLPVYSSKPSNVPVPQPERQSHVVLEDNALYDNTDENEGQVYDNEDSAARQTYDNPATGACYCHIAANGSACPLSSKYIIHKSLLLCIQINHNV